VARERIMASKLRAVVALLLATACLLAATVADARPLKEQEPSPMPSSEGDDGDARVPTAVVVESPAGDMQMVVVGTAEDDGAGRNKFVMSIDMLGGIKGSGPSPGDGH
jgi:hypothetical protein